MYRQCTTEKTTTQQKRFQDVLFHSMQDKLYTDITITDLCSEASLSRNIFYRLFDCKDDVLYSLIDQYLYECSHFVNSEDAKENLTSFFRFWKENSIILGILDKNHLGPLLSTRGTLCCCRMDFGMQKFIQADWNNFDVEILSFYVSAFIGLLFSWYHSDFSRSVDEMADITFQLLCQPPLLVK